MLELKNLETICVLDLECWQDLEQKCNTKNYLPEGLCETENVGIVV